MSRNKSNISPAYLMAGMAMGVDFLSQFQKRIIANGGSPLLLHHMSLPGNAKMLDAVAKIAIAQHFPVPRTEIELRTMEWSYNDDPDRPRRVESDKHYFWNAIHLDREYGIPCQTFGNINSDADVPIPRAILQQIEEHPLPYPLVVHFEGENYVVTCLATMGEEYPMPGEIISSGDTEFVTISATKYFDLEH